MGPGPELGPEAGAHHWGSPAPDRQWPGTDAPAVIRCGDGRPGADTTLSLSRDGGRTGKKINVSGVPAKVQKKRIAAAQDKGMGPLVTVSIRAFSDGYQGESIEHSLMDPRRERGAQNAQQYVLLETDIPCFAIASRIIVGVLSKKSMSASTKHNSEKCMYGAQDKGMGPLASIEHSLIDTRDSVAGRVHQAFSQANRDSALQGKLTYCR